MYVGRNITNFWIFNKQNNWELFSKYGKIQEFLYRSSDTGLIHGISEMPTTCNKSDLPTRGTVLGRVDVEKPWLSKTSNALWVYVFPSEKSMFNNAFSKLDLSLKDESPNSNRASVLKEMTPTLTSRGPWPILKPSTNLAMKDNSLSKLATLPRLEDLSTMKMTSAGLLLQAIGKCFEFDKSYI